MHKCLAVSRHVLDIAQLGPIDHGGETCVTTPRKIENQVAAARVCSRHAVFISMCPFWVNTRFHYAPNPQNLFWVIHTQATQRSSTAANSGYPVPHRLRVRGVIDHSDPEEMVQAAPVHRRVHRKEQRSGRHTKCFTLYELLCLAE